MRDKCFDQGTIQAFTDGELNSGSSERLLRHISVCADCAALLAETEEESALAFSVLDEELNVLVPTERLRAKVFASIDELSEGRRAGWLSGVTAGLAEIFSFRNPGLAAAAGALVIVFVFVIGMNVLRQAPDTSAVAVNESGSGRALIVPSSTDPGEEKEVLPAQGTAVGDELADTSAAEPRTMQVRSTRGSSDRRYSGPSPVDPPAVINAVARSSDSSVTSEDSYLQTIATLDRTVSYSKELLRPSERVEFERDLAIVNDAIVKMKGEVRRNPGNQAAREVLKSSYQNKIDLLNSVAEKTELMASLQ